jgi:hypothetical protein
VDKHLNQESIVVEGDLRLVFLSIKKDNRVTGQPRLTIAPKMTPLDSLTRAAQVRSALHTTVSIDDEYVILVRLKGRASLTSSLVQILAGCSEMLLCLAPELDQSVAAQPHKCFNKRAAWFLKTGLRRFQSANRACKERCLVNQTMESMNRELITEVWAIRCYP